MTVLEAIQKTAAFLDQKGVESSRLQAELLLAHVLQSPRLKLYLNFERQLQAAETDAFRELVRRRGQREPLQHILGTVSFCGIELASTRAALIPRPETETLAQIGWELLAQHPAPAPCVFDFGTGTGCLAIALALKVPRARVWAGDISAPALELARANAIRTGVADRIQFLPGDGFTALPPDQRFDLIVSNPPYIPTPEIATLQPEVRDFDPHQALDGGADGLCFYRQIAAQGSVWLNPTGRIAVELGDDQAASVSEIFAAEKWIVEGIRQDYSLRDRFLLARRP